MIKKAAIIDWLTSYGLIIILIATSFWVAAKFVEPAPEKKIIMAAGSSTGAYYKYAQAYKQSLAGYGVELEILKTRGSAENLDLLQEGKADVAFVQSGMADDTDKENLEALSSLYYEPLWIFAHEDMRRMPDSLGDLKGRVLAIGANGSGTQKVVKQLLAVNGVTAENTTFLPLSVSQVRNGKAKEDVDVVFTVAGITAGSVQDMFTEQEWQVVSLRRAAAYEKHFPFISKVVLQEGVIDLEANIPSADISLVSPVAMMVARNDIHAALKTLLMQAGTEVFAKKVPFKDEPGFPSQRYIDFDLSKEATRFFEDGFGFLNEALPFWIADMVGRLKVMLIPLLAVFLPLVKIAAPTYKWRIRSRIYRWYKNLQKWETLGAKDEVEAALEELRKIDDEVKATNVPLSYNDEVYNLRMHIQLVKDKLRSAGSP